MPRRCGSIKIRYLLIVACLLVLPSFPGDLSSVRASRSGEILAVGTVSDFRNSIGVNTHIAFHWTNYADITTVMRALRYTGIEYIRDVFLPWDSAAQNYEDLAKAGFKFNLFIPVIDGKADVSDFVSRVNEFNARFPGAIVSVEGPNEVDIWPVEFNGGSEISNAAELQRSLFSEMRKNSDLANISVYNFTIGYSETAKVKQMGLLPEAVDYANTHAYVWSWGTPYEGLQHHLGYAPTSTPGRPIVITETGYTIFPEDPYSGVTEEVHAKLLLPTLLDAFTLGVKRTFFYELIDGKPDPDFTDPQQHFGVFRSDGTPKPAAIAIHNLTSLLSGSGGGQAEASVAPQFAITAHRGNVRHLLLRADNGIYFLAVWPESSLWDRKSKVPLAIEPQTATVKFGDSRFDLQLFDLLDAQQQATVHAGVTEIELQMSDRPLLIRVERKAE